MISLFQVLIVIIIIIFFCCKCRLVEYGIVVDAPRLGKLLLFIRIDLSTRLSRCKIKLFVLVCLYFPSILMIF